MTTDSFWELLPEDVYLRRLPANIGEADFAELYNVFCNKLLELFTDPQFPRGSPGYRLIAKTVLLSLLEEWVDLDAKHKFGYADKEFRATGGDEFFGKIENRARDMGIFTRVSMLGGPCCKKQVHIVPLCQIHLHMCCYSRLRNPYVQRAAPTGLHPLVGCPVSGHVVKGDLGGVALSKPPVSV